MPHARFGETGFLLGGGGAKHGLAQAVQLKLFFEFGIKPDKIVAESVGASNSLDPENAIQVWKNCIISPETIYEFNPVMQKIVLEIIETMPHVPAFPPKTPTTWKAFITDLKIQIYKIIFAARLIKPLLQPSFYKDSASIKTAKEAGEPLLRELSRFIEEKKIYKIPAFLDMEPLIKVISEKINLEAALNRKWETYFLVRLLKTGENEFLKASNKEEILQLVRASSAIRALFPPVFMKNNWYCDGGQSNPFPAEFLFDQGCDTIFAFVKNYEIFEPSSNIFEALFFEESLAVEKQLFRIQKEKAQTRAKKENKNLFIIHPAEPTHPDLGLLSISPEAIEYTIENESKATIQFLAKILE